MEDKDIYSKIREIRKSRGMTVNTLAQKMGESHQKLGRIERGRRSLTIDYLMKVSKALDTPIENFFNQESDSKEKDSQASDCTIILNEIVVLVENTLDRLHISLDAKQKGSLVSKAYELAMKFPEKQRSLFVEALVEGVFTFKAQSRAS